MPRIDNVTEKASKRISESEELNPIGEDICIAIYELFSDYMESGMSAVDAFRRSFKDTKAEFEGDADATSFFNQIESYCKTIRDFNELAAKYDLCDWGSEEDRAAFMDDEEYEDYLNSRIVLTESAKRDLKEPISAEAFLDADSDLVHTKHINDYIHKDNTICIPDAPSKIEIAGHTIDYDEDEGVVVFDGVVAKCDDREELAGGETGVYYADTDNGTYTILLYYQRHGLLADVAVLEPELTNEVQYNLV